MFNNQFGTLILRSDFCILSLHFVSLLLFNAGINNQTSVKIYLSFFINMPTSLGRVVVSLLLLIAVMTLVQSKQYITKPR